MILCLFRQTGNKSKERVWLTPRTFSQLTETVIHILFIWKTTFRLLTKFVKLIPGTKPGSYPERVLLHVWLNMYHLLWVIEIWKSCHCKSLLSTDIYFVDNEKLQPVKLTWKKIKLSGWNVLLYSLHSLNLLSFCSSSFILITQTFRNKWQFKSFDSFSFIINPKLCQYKIKRYLYIGRLLLLITIIEEY